jgi:hypothetical protein
LAHREVVQLPLDKSARYTRHWEWLAETKRMILSWTWRISNVQADVELRLKIDILQNVGDMVLFRPFISSPSLEHTLGNTFLYFRYSSVMVCYDVMAYTKSSYNTSRLGNPVRSRQ